ncbi:hypothetical protein, partial [Enterovibrio nigricans]
ANSPESNGTKFTALSSAQWDVNQGELTLSIAIRDEFNNLLPDTSQIDSVNAEIISGPGTLTVNPSGRSITIPRPDNGAIYDFGILSAEDGNTVVKATIITTDGIPHSIPNLSVEFSSYNSTKGSIVIETQPVLGKHGDFITQPVVRLVNKSGNTYTDDNTTLITARLISGSGSLNANNQSTVVTSNNGFGRYANLHLSKSANNTSYKLAFYADGFSVGVSNEIKMLSVAELIKEDVKDILERDLFITVNDLESSYSNAAKRILTKKTQGDNVDCYYENFDFDGAVNKSGDQTTSAQGTFGNKSKSCGSGVSTSLDGTYSVDVSDDLDIKSFKSTFNFLKEWANSSTSFSGLSFGGYGKDSAVSRNNAEGNITGVGINVGYYGATIYNIASLQYYVALGGGYHSYELDFSNYDGGDINSNGDYKYLAGLTGLAISTEKNLQEFLFKPRIGVNLSYAVTSKASIYASQGNENSHLEFDLPNYSGVKYYVDGDISRQVIISGYENKFTVTPKLWHSDNNVYGQDNGKEIEFEYEFLSQYSNLDLSYSIGKSGVYTSKSIKAKFTRNIEIGQLSFGSNFAKSGEANFELSFNADF